MLETKLTTHCLLAVRTAAGSFLGRHNIRSSVFERTLGRCDELEEQLVDVQKELVEHLYEAVPKANSPAERHVLLQLKRDIHSRRPASEDALQLASSCLQPQIERYNLILRARTMLLEDNREAIFAELRNQLDTLVAGPEFRLAVDYSCPWLIEAYHRHGPGDLSDFSNEERGIYSYAARFFSKANPFHLFAQIAFPASMGLVVENECEVVLDPTLILDLEKRLLPQVKDAYRTFAYPSSFLKKDDSYYFLVSRRDGLCQIAIRANPVLELLIEFFQKHGHSLGDCIDCLAEAFPQTDRTALEQYLAQLVEQGIMEKYLVRNFEHFAHDLHGIDSGTDPAIHELQAIHLAQVSINDLARIERQIARLNPGNRRGKSRSHHVNAYSSRSFAPYENLVQHLYPELRSLKPLFALSSGFYEWSYVYEQFIRSSCAAHPENKIPYLELVTRFLRNSSSLVAQYHPSAHCPQEDWKARHAWLQRLENCQDVLTEAELESLLANQPAGFAPDQKLCFNGPVDASSGTFYVQNIFPGNARYTGRYLLGQSGTRLGWITRVPDLLDVQVVPPYDYNRCHVAAMLPAGTGLHGRYRHHFEHWIPAGDIMVEVSDGKVVYSERNSGQCLRFHFFGFLLATLLTPEYHMLLTSHADFFYNPFFRRSPLPPGKVAQYVPPLRYGSVCLRRPQWRFLKGAFDQVWKCADILQCSVKLLELIRQSAIDFTECYFELLGSGIEAAKPRYLDLRNPLSVHTFRRSVRSAPPQAVVALSPLAPSPQGFFQQTPCPALTEFMIEV
jgi:hypothetical protein